MFVELNGKLSHLVRQNKYKRAPRNVESLRLSPERLLEMQNRSVYPQNDSPNDSQNDSTYFTDYTGIYVQQQHAYNKQVWIIINLL